MKQLVGMLLLFSTLLFSVAAQAQEARQMMEMERQPEPTAVNPVQRVPAAAQRVAPVEKMESSLPDLSLDQLSASPDRVSPGNSVTLIALVGNSGSAMLPSVQVIFLDAQSRKKLGEQFIDIGAASKQQVTITVPLVGQGIVTIKAVVNPERRVAEKNGLNNEKTTVVTIVTPAIPTQDPVLTKKRTPPASTKTRPVGRNTPAENEALGNKFDPGKDKRNEQLPGGSVAGSGSGSAGPPTMPGGISEPGSGGTTPPFGAEGDVPGITDPTGMGRPGDKIVTPDSMDKHSPSGSYGNLYGGVNPARDPRQGGGRGLEGVFSGLSKEEVNKLVYIFDPKGGTNYNWRKNADGAVVDETRNSTTIYYFYNRPDGSVFVEKQKYDKAGESGNDIDGDGDKGSKTPLSEEDRRRKRQAALNKVYEEVKNSPAVQSDGGVVDPVRNQANGDGNAAGSGNSSGQGKAPVAAKAPNSQKPGSLLTGGGRIDTDKPSTQVKLPQGFQVIDPMALQSAAEQIESFQEKSQENQATQ